MKVSQSILFLTVSGAALVAAGGYDSQNDTSTQGPTQNPTQSTGDYGSSTTPEPTTTYGTPVPTPDGQNDTNTPPPVTCPNKYDGSASPSNDTSASLPQNDTQAAVTQAVADATGGKQSSLLADVTGNAATLATGTAALAGAIISSLFLF